MSLLEKLIYILCFKDNEDKDKVEYDFFEVQKYSFKLCKELNDLYENKLYETLTINKNENIDHFRVFILKKSLFDLKFYEFILDLNNEFIINNLIKDITICFKNGYHFNCENEFINLIFYDDEMCKIICDKLLLMETHENMEKIMFRVRLENKLLQKEEKKKIIKI